MITIADAMQDRQLLGAALGDASTWATWLAVLKSAFGLRLDRQQRRAFASVAGARKPPQARVRELWAIIGRRSGKSRMAALVGCFLALFGTYNLAHGEVGEVAILAASRDQARVVFGYAHGFLTASPVLAQEVESTTFDEIRLRNGLIIAVRVASFRTIRGRTLVGAVFDETSFWRSNSTANPDVETYRAVLPALATSRGMLVSISSPYRRHGLVFERHRDAFAQDDPDVLVVAGASEQFNPTLDKAIVRRAMQADPEAAAAEWMGEFRRDLASYLDDATIDAAIDHDRPLELPPRAGIKYGAFIDASGGRHDAFTICIGHVENFPTSGSSNLPAPGGFIADVVRGRSPPFNPQEVVREYAELARQYHCKEVIGDNFAAEWVAASFRENRIRYRRSEQTASALYVESLSLFSRGAIRIPDHAKLVRELRLLERRTGRVGRDTVSHPRGAHDDHANALVGAARHAIAPRRVPVAMTGNALWNRGSFGRQRDTVALIQSMTRR